MTWPLTGCDLVLLLIVLAVAVISFTLGRLSSRRKAFVSDASVSVASGEGIELYVGNLPYKTSERELIKLFEKHGNVISARLIKNKGNGKSRGYGFIEMATQDDADKAVKAMSGAEVHGRKLVVNEAKSQSRD